MQLAELCANSVGIIIALPGLEFFNHHKDEFIMRFNSFYTLILGSVAGFMLALNAQANILVNGGFEDNDVAPGSWSYFVSSSVPGWDGDNIEIWDSLGGVVAPEGTQHAELNAHPFDGSVFSIYQNFATVMGQTYEVSFFYSARESSSEQFSFSVGSLAALLDDHVVGSWKKFTGSFVATSSMSTIAFTTVDSSTVGNFLDDVVVKARVAVDEPSPLALLMFGLVGLFFCRKKLAV